MIRLLVSDIDGTLVTKDKELTPAVRRAAEMLKDRGVKLVLVSSRPPHGVALFADALHLDTPRAAFNGGVITDAAGHVLHTQLLSEDAAKAAIAYLQTNGIAPWLFTADEWLLTDPNGDYVAWEKRTVQMEFRVVSDLTKEASRTGKIMAASKDFEKLGACELALQGLLDGQASVHRSQAYYLDITHKLANKGEVVRRAALMLGVDLKDTACIGDMPNDLPMFGVAGWSVAMGNAPAAMQAQADYVTGANQDSGWAQAVEHFILPNAEGA